MRSSVISVGLAVWAASGFAAGERESKYDLPCDIASIAPSGDGKTVWVPCFVPSPGKPYMFQSPSILYALDTATGRLRQVVKTVGAISVTPAPVGPRVVVVLQKEGSNGRAFLYDGSDGSGKRPEELPSVGTYMLTWTSDARKILFSAGNSPNAQGDSWDILAAFDIERMFTSKAILSSPTEYIYVCPRTGHIFSEGQGDIFDKSGQLARQYAVENDANLHLVNPRAAIPAGNFSAGCRYVATTPFWHGPIPWRIVNASTGKELYYFDNTFGESGKEEFVFESWNPKSDNLLLRKRVRAKGSGLLWRFST